MADVSPMKVQVKTKDPMQRAKYARRLERALRWEKEKRSLLPKQPELRLPHIEDSNLVIIKPFASSCRQFLHKSYLIHKIEYARVEDRATLGSDPSAIAGLEAGGRRGISPLPFFCVTGFEPIATNPGGGAKRRGGSAP
jgi:hypothetical protein